MPKSKPDFETFLMADKVDHVGKLVKDELMRAIIKHPTPFNNAHEGFAVLQEEVDELWDDVKSNLAYSHFGMREAIQIAAMAIRFVVELHEHPGGDTCERLDLVSGEKVKSPKTSRAKPRTPRG